MVHFKSFYFTQGKCLKTKMSVYSFNFVYYSLGENHHVWLVNLFLCRCCVHDYTEVKICCGLSKKH